MIEAIVDCAAKKDRRRFTEKIDSDPIIFSQYHILSLGEGFVGVVYGQNLCGKLLATRRQLRDSNRHLLRHRDGLKHTKQRLADEHQQQQSYIQQLKATEQQLRAANQQIAAEHQQLKAANQQLQAVEQQLRAANQQLRATEAALRQSREHYKMIFEGTMSAIVAYKVSEDGRDFFFDTLNPAAERIEQIKSADVVGKNLLEIYPNLADSELVECFRRVWRSGRAEHVPVFRYKDDRIDGWRDNYVYKLPTGEIVAMYLDITQRKRAQEALKQSEHEKDLILSSVWDMITYQGPDLRIRWANRSAVKNAGVKTLDGKLCYEIWHGRTEPCLDCPVVEAIRSGQPAQGQTATPDGRHWHMRAYPVTDEKGNVIGAVESTSEITDRIKAQNKLLEYQDQLQMLNSELTLAEERQRRRIASELHDRISQALVISKSQLDGLCQCAKQQQYGDELESVRDLLAHIIEETKALTFDLSSPILYELGFEAAVVEWLYENVEQKHGIKCEFQDDGLSKPLEENVKVLLFRDVREMLINVIKHARATIVRVTIQRNDSTIEVSVEDDGQGFDPTEAMSVPSRSDGFGLFSIRERLERQRGRLKIDSQPGRGTRVTVIAPLKEAD